MNRAAALLLVCLLAGCASSRPMTACEMAGAVIRASDPGARLTGHTWIKQGACG